MSSSERRRFFNQSERNEIYRLAEGLCEGCGKSLDDRWEAHHRIPFALGGATTVENGLALCHECHSHIGTRLPDMLPRPRPFQKALVETVLERILTGQRETVAWVSAGSGKTDAWLRTVNALYRNKRISTCVTLVPRIALRVQAEFDSKEFVKLCNEPKIKSITGRDNIDPLVPTDRFGYVTTYQAIVADSKNQEPKRLHLRWAQENQGKFVLILDEAQFLGLGVDDQNGGTQAAAVVTEIAQYALHVIVLTGTYKRSDNQPIIFAKYGDPDKKGARHLIPDVLASYPQGVSHSYLRPCVFDLSNGQGEFDNGEQFTLEQLEERLSQVLRHGAIWQELVNRTVEAFRGRRKISPAYRCLIAAMDQDHARKIRDYLKSYFPEFKTVMAITDENRSLEVLRLFKPEDKGGQNIGDILVTVGMAYIGYDCPSISAVGVLTNRRWEGWLEQLIMRGGRMWKDRPKAEQYLVIVCPNDPAMRSFAEIFRAASDEGLKERKKKDGPGSTPEPDDVTVLRGELTNEIAMGLSKEQDVDAEELSGLRHFQNGLSSPVEATVLAEIFRKIGEPIPRTQPPEKPNNKTERKTDSERRKEWGNECQELLSELIRVRYQVRSQENRAAFERIIKRLSKQLNDLQKVKDVHGLNDEQWLERIKILKSWIGDVKDELNDEL